MQRPGSTYYYEGPRGTETSIRFDTNKFTLTVPSDWRPGKYKLTAIYTGSIGNSTQFRNHRVTGTVVSTSGLPPRDVCGKSDLNLSVLDLKILNS